MSEWNIQYKHTLPLQIQRHTHTLKLMRFLNENRDKEASSHTFMREHHVGRRVCVCGSFWLQPFCLRLRNPFNAGFNDEITRRNIYIISRLYNAQHIYTQIPENNKHGYIRILYMIIYIVFWMRPIHITICCFLKRGSCSITKELCVPYKDRRNVAHCRINLDTHITTTTQTEQRRSTQQHIDAVRVADVGYMLIECASELVHLCAHRLFERGNRAINNLSNWLCVAYRF